MNPPRVLFLVEGNTDIRFVTGLCEISSLTMALPAATYNRGDLKERIRESGAQLQVDELAGGRILFQFSSLLHVLRRARDFDIILCQEVLRGALSGTLAGALTNTPVITYMGISPLEYFRCRRERGQIGPWKAWAGETFIRFLMSSNGALTTRCLVMGPYLRGISLPYCKRTEIGLYYGVDTELYAPVDDARRLALRKKLNLPADKFIIFLSSRISHEKDPETVLRAAMLARKNGLDAVVINLGGGYQDFLKLGRSLGLEQPEEWVLGRPAAHPMKDLAEYYQASDCLAQASLAEGLGLSPMEALASGIPAVCTAVGGLTTLQGFVRLTPRSDPVAMSREFLWIAANRQLARDQALAGCEVVRANWSRKKAFSDLAAVFAQLAGSGRKLVAEEA
jgi:glycosyltransferase involved in cell wall biosynthesis